MSSGQLARNRALSLESDQRSRSQGRKTTAMADFSMSPIPTLRDFEPCDATASMFLYASGCQVVVAHHDTLKIERRFSRHTEDVRLLAVDNCSDRGAGRLVITYDVGQTAIVWDLMTGDEIARFASYNDLSVAAWMRNGNVAFGNAQGNVILFEPSTSEHISARTINQVPITAIAPAADCRTYAIGYQNGSILIASLQPKFTIIHNLMTNRAPSPVVTLAWHASSPRQKSDMLATQTHDGDLRVWSVAKSANSKDPAKVVRVLRRREDRSPGPNWLAWSKNGRIVQFSDGECTSWDVRTKNVTFENVPILPHVRGIAIYGSGATMFTLDQSSMVHQFDLNTPPVMVCEVQHPAPTLPPSPPVSIEEQKAAAEKQPAEGYTGMPINIDVVSESDEEHLSPLARITREIEAKQEAFDRFGAFSPVSSQVSYASKSSANSRGYRRQGSTISRGLSDHTVMSFGSSARSREPSITSSRDTRDSLSQGSSTSGGSYRSRGRTSKLRQEVLRSPEDRIVVDLFKYTKSRLSDLPYSHPQLANSNKSTTEQLRRQMIMVIFGFDGEAADLIRDEISRHQPGTPNHLLLNKWLGDLDADIMASSSKSMTSSDWMLLALSGIGGHASQQKVARAYVQRLLEKGDVHTAATIMIGMGDQNDAIEIYVSHRRYMEALILTAYVYPADWKRQVELVRKWGEWAVQHSQQQLAIRCFSCTASELMEPYFSPPPTRLTFVDANASIPEMLSPMSPPLSPPGVIPRGPQRSIAKTAALKLVTSFGDKHAKAKFFGTEADKTPMGGYASTPIAESAVDLETGTQTAYLHAPPIRSAYNTPASARTATPGGYGRARLPSIGEMPTDVATKHKRSDSSRPGTDDDSSEVSNSTGGSYSYRQRHRRKLSNAETTSPVYKTLAPISRAATTSPVIQKQQAQGERNIAPLPSPAPLMFSEQEQKSRDRNGSRDRKPLDLHIHWPPMQSVLAGTAAPSTLSATSSRKRNDAVSPVLTGSSLDPFMSSLEAAKYTSRNHQSRETSRDPSSKHRARSSSRKRTPRNESQDRGRPEGRRLVKSGKRSPSSPVPMSPEDLRSLGAAFVYHDNRSESSLTYSEVTKRKPRDVSHGSQTTAIPGSRNASRIRRMSPEPLKIDTGSRTSSCQATGRSRKHTPALEPPAEEARNRSQSRGKESRRSPVSPVPMSPDDYHERLSTLGDSKRYERSRQRSATRTQNPELARSESPDKGARARSGSRQGRIRDMDDATAAPSIPAKHSRHKRSVSDLKVGDLTKIKLDRQAKKEAAARELEERRRSLVRRPSAPPIIHPDELSPITYRPGSRNAGFRSDAYVAPILPARSQTVSPEEMRLASGRFQEPIKTPVRTTPAVGLPATPKAMQHPKYDPDNKDVPHVPGIPNNYNDNNATQFYMASLDQIASSTGAGGRTSLSSSATFQALPRTTYQAAARGLPRSMSAPVPEEPLSPAALPANLPTHPAFQVALPASSRRRTNDTLQNSPSRKVAPGESPPGTLGYQTRNNVAVYSDGTTGDVVSDSMMPPPPPPPPAPPILPQLQHLAMPPPPPPAPMQYRIISTSPVEAGSRGTGIIEIVVDESDHEDDQQDSDSEAVAQRSNNRSSNDSTVKDHHQPADAMPAPLFAAEREKVVAELLSSKTYSTLPSTTFVPGHSRTRSGTQPPLSFSTNLAVVNNNTTAPVSAVSTGSSKLASRFSRATERLRSSTRGPTLDTKMSDTSSSNVVSPGGLISRTISPPIEGKGTGISPYESMSPAARWEDGLRGSGEESREGLAGIRIPDWRSNDARKGSGGGGGMF